MVIVWHLILDLTLTSFPDESQVAVNRPVLVNAHISPCSVFIVYSLVLPVSVTGLDKSPEAIRFLWATQQQTSTEKQAIERATIRFLLMGLMWSLTDVWTLQHLAVCELCAAVYIIIVSLKWAEVLAACAQSAVAVSSHAVMTCLLGKKRHWHCNYVQRSWSVWQMNVVVVQSSCLRGFSPHTLAKLTLGASLLG